MSTSTDNPNVSEAPLFDPFPEPNTMPSGWDLAALPDPQPASVSSAGDLAEA
jgi:hypothetical protein